jgi:hypothetical protein
MSAGDAPYFVVTLDRGRVRIYRSTETAGPGRLQLQLQQSHDVPEGHDAYFASESDQAGRFPGGVRGAPADVATHAGGSIDERLPMQREHERRIAALLASLVEQFLLQHPTARWDFVAPAPVHHAVWERLSRDTRDRVGVTVTKDLVHLPVRELGDRIVDARGAVV